MRFPPAFWGQTITDAIEVQVRLSEFPSLSWLDKEPESALKGIREIVKSVIKDMTHAGEEIPQPIACKRYSGKFMVRVPPEVHRSLAIQALESGVSLNRIAGAKLSR
jgi:predicted HicB family RNase H-like nuclease